MTAFLKDIFQQNFIVKEMAKAIVTFLSLLYYNAAIYVLDQTEEEYSLFGKPNFQQFKLTKVNGKKIDKKDKKEKTIVTSSLCTHEMTLYIINFILKTSELRYNKDLPRLIC